MKRPVTGTAPKLSLPKGTIDCHIHIVDTERFDIDPKGPPAPPRATLDEYRQVMKWLGIDRVMVVQSNCFHLDNSSMLAAIAELGECAKGIAAVSPEISDAELEQMTKMGVVGTRIMDILQGAVGMKDMLAVNERILPFGWTMIVQFDGRNILDHMDALKQIKGNYVIDHIGKFLEPVAVDSPQMTALKSLVDRGNCYVKIAGCNETSLIGAPNYEDVGALAVELIAHAPDRTIWGSNWPHNSVRSLQDYPNDAHLADLVSEWAGSETVRQQIYVDTPAKLYGFA